MKSVLILRHQSDVSMGSLAGVLSRANLDFRQLDLYDNTPSDLPWDEMAGLIVLGGAMSANDGDKFPFLVAELDWLRRAVQRDLPTLGICLGAQLLAKAHGKRVYRHVRSETGWSRVELLPAAVDDRLFQGRASEETVFHWHDDTFDLPDAAVHLAQSPACANQAFRMGNFAYGLQFHVEMVPELMEKWLQKHAANGSGCNAHAPLNAATKFDADAIRAAAAASFPPMNSFSECILNRFARLCRECM